MATARADAVGTELRASVDLVGTCRYFDLPAAAISIVLFKSVR